MRNRRALFALVLFTLAGSTLYGTAALSDDDGHERARRALQTGETLPFRRILDQAERDYPGDLLEAEMEHKHGRLYYEVKILGADGRVAELYYDARTGELLKIENGRR